MRIVIQRVTEARVIVDGHVVGAIGSGLLVFIGVAKSDNHSDADYLLDKILGLRIFPDEAGKMNLSVLDARGDLLLVSQFTLYADCRKGRRPSFDLAAGLEQARALYDYFVDSARRTSLRVETGEFQTQMEVHLVNQGPVTIIMDSVGSGRL